MEQFFTVLVDQGGFALFAALALWAMRQSFKERLEDKVEERERIERDRETDRVRAEYYFKLYNDQAAGVASVVRENTEAIGGIKEMGRSFEVLVVDLKELIRNLSETPRR